MAATVMAGLLLMGGILILISFHMQLHQLRSTHEALAQVASGKISAYVDELQRKLSYLARIRGLTDFDAATQSSLLESLAYQNKAYEALGLVDHSGRVWRSLSRSGEHLPEDWSLTAAFRRSFLAEEDFVSPIELAEGEQLPGLTLAVPIRNSRNDVAGILVARISLKYLWAVLDESRIGRSGYAYLVDQRNYFIAESGVLPRQFEFVDLTAIADSAASGSLGTSMRVYRGLHGTMVLGESSPVQATNWRVVVEMPVAESYAPLLSLLGLMAAGLAAALAFTCLLAMRLSRRITGPLKGLTLAATRIREGELGARVDSGGDAEFRILADAFNRMAERREEAEEALAESEGRYRSLFESSLDGIMLTAQDGRIFDANPAACRMLGRTREELCQAGRNGVVKTEDPRLADALAERMSTGSFTGELSFVRKGGENFPVEISTKVFSDRAGMERASIVFRDITGRKRAEAELLESLSEAETAKEALQKSSAENIALLAELQHRVKNSFNMIASMISLTAISAGPGEGKTYFVDLEARVRAMAELYSLLHSSGSFTEIRLDDYCARIASGLSGLSDRVTIRLDSENIVIPVKNAAPIGLIMTELVTNALKYAYPGERQGRVTVSISRSGSGVSLLVSDDGIGLEPGFDASTSQGMGFRLIRALSGQIDASFSVESRGSGTSCRLVFQA
jgi:PAS domain S-box-containing protein